MHDFIPKKKNARDIKNVKDAKYKALFDFYQEKKEMIEKEKKKMDGWIGYESDSD